MKKTVFVVMFFCLANFLFSQNADYLNVRNGGFEMWNNEDNSDIEPDYWHTITSATGKYSGMVSKQVFKSTKTRPGSNGKYSVLLRPRSILGVLANGNLTCGRINASSLKTTNHEDNYNYTQRSNPDFSTPVNAVPDSIVAWVCFRAKNEHSQANFVSVVHGDVDFIYAGPEYSKPQDQVCAASGPCFISRTSVAESDDYVWRRVSVPFVMKHSEVKPRYILILFSTNKIAGEGSSKDELYIDDVELIYNRNTPCYD